MDPELIIYGAILLAVPLLLGGMILVTFGGQIESHRRTSRRLAGLEGGNVKTAHIDSLRKEAGGRSDGGPGLVEVVERRLQRAAVSMSPVRLLGLAAVIGAAVFAGLTLATEAGMALRLLVSPVLGVAGVHMWLSKRISARLAIIEETLPDAVELMVRSLRVGHPFSSAVQIVAREIEGPFGEEMAIVADEMSYGRDVGEALTEMAERVGLQDMRFLAVAVTIQRQSGGNLAEVLEGLAKVVRARFRLFRRVKAITSEAKFSGFFLSGFPIFATIGINVIKPDYYDEVRETVYFMPAVAIVAVLLVANIVVMRRLVDIKV